MKLRLLSLLVGGVVAVAVGSVAAQDNAFTTKATAKPAGKPGITAEQRVMLDEQLLAGPADCSRRGY